MALISSCGSVNIQRLLSRGLTRFHDLRGSEAVLMAGSLYTTDTHTHTHKWRGVEREQQQQLKSQGSNT